MHQRMPKPTSYSTVQELRRALLVQARLHRQVLSETAASKPIVMSPGVRVADSPPVKPAKRGPLEKLDLMYAQLRVLKNIETQLTTSFKSDPSATQITKSVKALIQTVSKRADEHRRDLAKSARGQVSQTLVRANHSLIRNLQDDLKGFYDDMRESYLIGQILPKPNADPIDAEIAFIKIDGLRSDDGYRHPLYYIIIAHPLAEASRQAPLLVASTTEFKVPSRISWDSTARTSNELLKIVKDLLVQDSILGKAFTRNIPVPKSRIRFAHPNIQSTSVKGDVITVKVKNPKQIESTGEELRRQLTSIVRQVDPKNRDLIRYKIERDTGIIKFVFSLPGKLRNRLITNDMMQKLRTVLDLSPTEAQRVKTAIENPDD